jgi:ribosomal protein L4
MRRLAIRSVLSAKVRDDQALVIKGIEQLEPKTRR